MNHTETSRRIFGVLWIETLYKTRVGKNSVLCGACIERTVAITEGARIA